MDWVVRGMGLFYIVGGALLVRAMAVDAMAGRLEQLVYGQKLADRLRHYWLRVGAALTVASGIAMVLLSPLMVPIMIANAVVQGSWLVFASRYFPSEDEDDALGRNQTINAFLTFVAVTVLVIILVKTGYVIDHGGPVTSKWQPVGTWLPVIGGIGVFIAMLVA